MTKSYSGLTPMSNWQDSAFYDLCILILKKGGIKYGWNAIAR